MSAFDDFKQDVGGPSSQPPTPIPQQSNDRTESQQNNNDSFNSFKQSIQKPDPIQTTAYLADGKTQKEAEQNIIHPPPPKDLSNLIQDAPATHAAMTTDGDHHAAIEPHVDALTNHELMLKRKAALDSGNEVVLNTIKGLGGSLVDLTGSVLSSGGLFYDFMSRGIESNLPPYKDVWHVKNNTPTFDAMMDVTHRVQHWVDPLSEKQYKEITENMQSGKHQKAADLIGEKSGNALGTVGSFIFCPEKAVVPIMASQSLSNTVSGYESDIKSGITKANAETKNVIDGMFNLALGTFGIKPTAKGLASKLMEDFGIPATQSVFKHYAKNVAMMAGMNLSGEIEHRFSQWMTGVKGAWDDFESAAPWSVAIGALAGGGLAHASHLMSEKPVIATRPDVAEAIRKNVENTQIETTKKEFKDTVKRYEDLDLHPQIKDPIYQDSLKNNKMDRAYIPVEAFEQYCADNKVEPSVAATEFGFGEIYNVAKKHGGTMGVDTIGLVRKLAGTQHTAAFADMVKFNPKHQTKFDADVDKVETTQEDKSAREVELEKRIEEYRKKAEEKDRESSALALENFRNQYDPTTGLRQVQRNHKMPESFFKPNHHTGVFIDLDNMKELNEHLEHHGTDQLLRLLGDKMTQIEMETGGKIKFARLYKSGDEYGASIEPGFEEQAKGILKDFQDWTDNQKVVLHDVKEKGRSVESRGPRFSLGFGGKGRSFEETMNNGDIASKENKNERYKSGKRGAWNDTTKQVTLIGGDSPTFREVKPTDTHDVRGKDVLSGESGNRYVDIARGVPSGEGTPTGGPSEGVHTEDQAINERVAEKLKPYQPLLDKIMGAGIYGKKAERWAELIKSTVEKVRKEISSRIIAAQERRQSREYKAEYKDIRNTEAKNYDAIPAVKAKAILETGKMPDGSALPPEIKDLNFIKGSAIENAHELYRFEDNDDLFKLAQHLGFETTSEMIDSATKLDDREEHLNSVADQVMSQRHDFPEAIADDHLVDLVMNDRLASVAREEAKYIASHQFAESMGLLKAIIGTPKTTEETQQEAEKVLGDMKHKDVSSKEFERLAQKSNKAAIRHFTKGEWQEMFDAKNNEILNHELFKQASEFEKRTEKTIKETTSVGKKAARVRLGKSGHDDLPQYDALQSKFSLPGNKSPLPATKTLSEWIYDEAKNGFPPQIEQSLATLPKMEYGDMKASDFINLSKALHEIKTISENRGKIIRGDALVQMENTLDALKATAAFFHPKFFDADGNFIHNAYDLHPGLKQQVSDFFVGQKNTRIVRPEYAVMKLDGYKMSGEFWRAIFQPIAEGEATRGGLRDMFEHDMAAAFKKAGLNDRAFAVSRFKKVFVKDLDTPKIKGNLTLENMLSILGHFGNDGNTKSIMDANGYTEDGIKAMIKGHLTSDHVQLVQDMIDHLSKYRDIYDKMFENNLGQKPKWVEGHPRDLETADGKTVHFRGGYWPLEFDGDRDIRAKELKEMKSIQDALGRPPGVAATAKGHLENRVGSGGRPPVMDFSSYENHVRRVHTDIAFGDAVRSVWKVVNHPEAAEMMKSILGKDGWETFNPWLRDIATQRRGFERGSLDPLVDWTIGSLTAVNIGYSSVSGTRHLLSMPAAAEEVGYKNLAKAHAQYGKSIVDRVGSFLMENETPDWNTLSPEHADFFKNPYKVDDLIDQIHEKSDYMKYVRRNGIDNNIAGFTKELGKNWGRRGFFGDIRAVAGAYGYDSFVHSLPFIIKNVDTMNAYPIWWGAYNKAVRGEVPNISVASGKDYMSAAEMEHDAIQYADSMVRTTKGAGNLSDLTAMQRGNAIDRIFTVFYNPTNTQLNAEMRATGRVMSGESKTHYLRYMTAAVLGVSILDQYLGGHGPDDKEKKSVGGTLGWAAKAVAKYQMGITVLARDLEWLIERQGKYEGPSVIEPVASMARGAVDAKDALTQHKSTTRAQDKGMIRGGGYALGLPVGQAYRTGEEIYDWSTGRYRPEDVEMPFGLGKIPGTSGINGVYETLTTGEKKRDK